MSKDDKDSEPTLSANAFEALERDFQEVLFELAGDEHLEKFRVEFEKLHRALMRAHENEKRLIIIDSSSLLYRAFHALPPLTNSKGQPTGAVYGFLLILFKAIKDVQANYVVACFDTKKPTFRHEQFVDYKAHRAPTPDGIISQFPVIK